MKQEDKRFCFADLIAALWLVDNYVTNPYGLWKNAGSPPYPNTELMRLMREQEVSVVMG